MFSFDLSEDIEPFILAHSPCKEYEIIQHLQNIGRLPKDCMANTLSLFRCHFLIFNALYRLHILSTCHNRYRLFISSLEICVETSSRNSIGTSGDSNSHDLAHHDPLCLFYLDTTNLTNTSETDVTHLLNNFWHAYFNDDKKHSALSILGLSAPVDFKTIKQQYRRLAMQHHPDRGGNADTLIEIHQAMQCLQHCYH